MSASGEARKKAPKSRAEKPLTAATTPPKPAVAHSAVALPIDIQVRQWLADASLRVTTARTSVLKLMAKASDWLTHTDIEAQMPAGIDRVTLYRTLDALAEAGLLARSVGADRVGRYSLAVGGYHRHHAHFHCDQCGGVFCLPMPTPQETSVPGGFSVQAVELSVRGQCNRCLTGAA